MECERSGTGAKRTKKSVERIGAASGDHRNRLCAGAEKQPAPLRSQAVPDNVKTYFLHHFNVTASCLDAEMSWCRSVLVPKYLDTSVTTLLSLTRPDSVHSDFGAV